MKHDAIVIGAGPAGSTAALLLARAGWSVAIVEKSAFPRRKVCGEFISAPTLSLLERMGLDDVIASAGPEVREIGVYAGERMLAAPMPRGQGRFAYGRALGRDRLDAMLLDVARTAGAAVYQPWRVERCTGRGPYECVIEHADHKSRDMISAPVLIAAHGSWEPAPATDRVFREKSGSGSDFLGFKAHFAGADLAAGRMPLVAFPGGYGGLVHTDRGRVTFSCCITRDALAACRRKAPGTSAGAAVLAHVLETCRGARATLASAQREESWLAAGPLQPGIRSVCGEGYFAVGNALGEAHPIVAEGISMAIQSAWLLCERLIDARCTGANAGFDSLAREYEAAYRTQFGARIRAASVFAAISMRPRAAAAAAGMLAAAPALLAFGAHCAGKAAALRVAG